MPSPELLPSSPRRMVGTTLAACPPPSASDAFFRVLNETERYSVTGDQLRLDAGDDGALVFERMTGSGSAGGGGR